MSESNTEPKKTSDKDRIINAVIEDEMKKSYLDYSMSVIVGRALPDVRDGLKPVHRRILYAMQDMGIKHSTPYKKCARIVGEVLGKYHPHGDMAVYDSLVRMAQDFSMRHQLIQGQGNFGCFTKDTKVKLADGRNLSFGELVAEDILGKTNYTFTMSPDGIKIARILKPRLTIKQAKLIKMALDNGEEIKCTLNHKFMLRNGEYEEAQNLKPGQSLMPFYERYSTIEDSGKADMLGYSIVQDPITSKWVFAHHLADEFNIKAGIYTKSAGRIRHHKDFDKLNNSPENIVRMQWQTHWKLHSSLTKDKHQNDPNYVKRLAEGRAAFWADESNKEANRILLSERNKNNWKNPVYREHMRKVLSQANKAHIQKHPELRVKYSERSTRMLTEMWKDPEYRKKMHELIIKGNKNHKSNMTGKRKFLAICKRVLEQTGTLNSDIYEEFRNSVYPYGCATSWSSGISKYYENSDVLDIIDDATINHKILYTELLKETEDVYDLTITDTHNFALAAGVFVHNSVDGDGAAAMRYTEARLAKISDELLQDLDKETVQWTDNFDGSLKEPTVLPSKFCNLLVNGSTGIAVGMATNIPPHNLSEISGGVIRLIDNPEANTQELMQSIRGPDFPTGGTIQGRRGILEAYSTGRGKVVVRSKIHEEEHGKQKRLIVTEIPYMINKSELIIQIADCVKEKRIEGISDLRDESDRKGMRIVIELKRDANPEVVKNQLFSYTRLQETFGITFLALVNNRPRTLTLKQILENYVLHRRVIVRKRTEFDLKKAKERAHILEGLIIAINDIDNAIALIKKSKSAQDAKEALMKRYKLTEMQAQAILDMRLQRLAQLEQEKIKQEHRDLLEFIKKLLSVLSDEKEILKLIRAEQEEIIKTYGDARKTEIVDGEEDEMEIEDLIPSEDVVITMSNTGYVKRMPLTTYKTQNRGGVGVIGAESKEEDFTSDLFIANTHSYLLVFTNAGTVHWVKAYRVPEGSRQGKGRPIINLIEIEKDESVSAVIPVREFDDKHFLLMATKKGIVKKTELSAYSNPRRGGIRAITLDAGDDVIGVTVTDGTKQIMLATRNGLACKFSESDVRPIGRTGMGVIGIRLDAKDEVTDMIIVDDKTDVLTLTSKGYGKRTIASEYRFINRGGKGVININLTDKNGHVVAVRAVKGNEDLMLATKQGMVIRTSVSQISSIGRNTQGVRVIKLRDKDELVSAAKIVSE